MEIEGRIIQELGIQSGTSKAGNPWKKGEWVLETHGSYPRKVKFHIFGEDRLANLAPQIQVGQDVAVSFDLESREFNGRWYTDVAVYAVRPAGQVANTQGGFAPGGFQAPTAAPSSLGAAPAGFPPAPEPNVPFGAPAAAPNPFGAPAADPGNASGDDLPF